jgi:hypothetical protein
MSPEQQRPPTGGRSPSEIDQSYVWGRPPDTYLAPRQLVRLMILRSRLDDRQELRNRAPTREQAA